MRIRKHELSPFPALLSTTQDRLTFTATELKALTRAADILDQAGDKAARYYADDSFPNASLSDLNMDLALMFCSGYLRDILSEKDGIRLE